MTNRARSHQKNDVRMILANPASIVFYISRFITMFTIKFRTIAALVWTLLPFAAFAQAPNPPSNLNALIGAENGTNWNAELSWQDNASNETGFAFYKKSNLGYTYLGALEQPNLTSVRINGGVARGETAVFGIRSYSYNPVTQQFYFFDILDFPALRGPDVFLRPSGSAALGIPFSQQVEVSNPQNAVLYAAGGLPSWLNLHPNTGVLSGTPTQTEILTISLSVTYADGWVLSGSYKLRIRPQAGSPVVTNAIPDWITHTGSSRNTALTGVFADAEAESAVRINTSLGAFDVILFNSATPGTVTNFMNYANAGKYNDVAFHRSIPGFVVQSGGFRGTGPNTQFASVFTSPPILNEPGLSNVRGTVAMAKIGGNPDSATSQFFVNTGNNASNLDYQNGGFTVFGRVAGNGMAIVDAINSLPRSSYSLNLDGSTLPTSFTDFPMNAATAPAIMDQSKLVTMLSVVTIPTMKYSITSNTDSSVASAGIVDGELRLQGLKGGQTTITLTATDLDLLSNSQQISVVVNDTLATWTTRTTFPNGQNAAAQNPDGDTLNNLLEFAFIENPAVPSHAVGPLPGQVNDTSQNSYMTLQFPVRKFTAGLVYRVEASHELDGNWTEIWNSSQGFQHQRVVNALDQSDRTLVTVRDLAAIGSSPRRFLRLKVIQN
jgi:cyclophilin family peptidyl-prolyl cis-trans isomerase